MRDNNKYKIVWIHPNGPALYLIAVKFTLEIIKCWTNDTRHATVFNIDTVGKEVEALEKEYGTKHTGVFMFVMDVKNRPPQGVG